MNIDTQHLPQGREARPPKKNWFVRHKFLTGVLAFFALFVAGAVDSSNDDPSGSTKTNTAGSTADDESRAAAPATIIEALDDAIGGDDRVSVADVSDESVLVKFAVSDNLTDNLIRVGVQKDVLDMLKVIHERHPGLHVTISGQFPLVDKYGNESTGQVLLLNYSSATLDKINYESIGLDVVRLADPSPKFLHPDFEF